MYNLVQNTGWLVGTDILYLFITQAVRMFETSSHTQQFTHMFPFWYLAFKLPTKSFFCQNWGMWRNCPIFTYRLKYKGKSHQLTELILFLISFPIVRFSHNGENMKENLINLTLTLTLTYISELLSIQEVTQ